MSVVEGACVVAARDHSNRGGTSNHDPEIGVELGHAWSRTAGSRLPPE